MRGHGQRRYVKAVRNHGLTAEAVHRHLIDEVRTRSRAVDLSIEALADAAQVSRSQLWRILRGECSPTVETLAALADALGCRVRDLLP